MNHSVFAGKVEISWKFKIIKFMHSQLNSVGSM